MVKNKDKIPVYISQGACLTPLGLSLSANIAKIKKSESAIDKINDEKFDKASFYGSVIDKNLLEEKFQELPLTGLFSTLEMMMLIVLQDIKSRFQGCFGPHCGLIVSSTKGNIDALSTGDISNYYLHRLAHKLGQTMGIEKEPIVISNACVSGIMAISVAKRLIQMGQYKHIVVVGGDLFSRFVYAGFQSFQAISPQPCRPYDKARDGITLGEAAAATFVTRDKEILEKESCFQIVGDSSINDANHISGPSRTGEGLFQSIQKAMTESEIAPHQIDVISAHGTATLYNDEMEAQAFHRSKINLLPVYSLKGYFGHTLGASGLLDTVIALAFAKDHQIPASLGYKEHGVTLPLEVNEQLAEKKCSVILKTASGFGGSNTAVLFKKEG